jgi:hypothetical protein
MQARSPATRGRVVEEATVAMSFKGLLARLSADANRDPVSARLAPGHVGSRASGAFVPDAPPLTLQADQDYVVVTLDRARLARGGRWWTDVVPMVYVSASLNYAGQSGCHVPALLGPSAFQQGTAGVPNAVVFRDLPLLGPYPFRGGALDLTVVLYEVPVDDTASRILDAVTATAGALPLGPALAPYLPIARAVVTGVGLLLDVGDTRPVIGCSHGSYGQQGPVQPGTFALVDDNALGPEELWVVDGELCRGTAGDMAQPLVDTDFVLYSLRPLSKRDDARNLPFVAPLHDRLVRFASSPEGGSWETAKTALSNLGQELYLSPDLVRSQASELYLEFRDEALELHRRSEALKHMGPGNLASEDRLLRDLNAAVMTLGADG